MASSTRACAIKKCEIGSCAVCHCCQNDLCLDHLKEHKDQLNAQLTPLANQINTFLDSLEHFDPNSLPVFKTIEQWRIAAHQTVDRFCENMRQKLLEQTKNTPLEKLRVTRNNLDQLIRKQGATRENIVSLSNDIRLIEQEINALQNIQTNLRPLVINDNTITMSDSSRRSDQTASGSNQNLNATKKEESHFQIFVQLHTGEQIFIWIKPSDTIMDLKKKIEERTKIPIDHQRLTYIGKQLSNEYSVATYDIQKLCTVNLFVRMKLPQNNQND